jgi:hypothetical protein
LSGEIVSVDPNMMALLRAMQKGEKLPRPFGKEVFLLKTYIAGTKYYKAKELKDNLKEGTFLFFTRESKNPYDNLAIMITNLDKNKLGYVPRAKNEIISNMMDAGKTIYGVVNKNVLSNDYIHIEIKVFLRDY